MSTITETEKLTDKLEEIKNQPAIVIYNDDVNTFEHVIDCLQKYCNHGYEQASQCTLIIHYKGKCDVKHGSYDKLLPIYEALLDEHLRAKIEV